MKKAMYFLFLIAASIAVAFYFAKRNQQKAPQKAPAVSKEPKKEQNSPKNRPIFPTETLKKPNAKTAGKSGSADLGRLAMDNFLTNSGFKREFKLVKEQCNGRRGLAEDSRKGADELEERLEGEYELLVGEKFSPHELERLDEVLKDPLVKKYSDARSNWPPDEEGDDFYEFREHFDPSSLSSDKRAALDALTEAHLKTFSQNLDDSFSEDSTSIINHERDYFFLKMAAAFKDTPSDELLKLSETVSESLIQRAESEKEKFLSKSCRELSDFADTHFDSDVYDKNVF